MKPRIWYSQIMCRWYCAVLVGFSLDECCGRGETPAEAYARWAARGGLDAFTTFPPQVYA